MESQSLEKARNYEKTMEARITPGDRPGFHLSARVGWMNDPNGFSFYNGEYHLFYQYYPYNSFWGPMHWGHAVSKDLLKWEYLPAVMAPDMPYDKDGCFSGSAIALPDGRRIMIGWMQNWDTCNLHTKDKPWFGQMCLPRELSIRDGRLIQKPIRELEKFRGAAVRHENVAIHDVVQLDGIHGRKVDMEVTIRPAEGKEIFQKFAIRFAQSGTCRTALSFRPHESILKVDRKFSGSRRAIINQRRGLVRTEGGCLKLRLILDSCSAEVFVNDGEQVFTLTFYTDQTADGISFFADGEAVIDVVKYDLML